MSETLMTRGRREALAHLSEECAEVIVAVAKTMRHGFDSRNPDDPDAPTNLEAIADELGDVIAGVDILLANLRGAQAPHTVHWFRERMRGKRREKLAEVERYLHHALVPGAGEDAAEWGDSDAGPEE